jgi:hypothetical protein
MASISGGKSHTFNALDLARTKASGGSPVLGARDSCGANSALDVHNGSSHGGAPFARGQSLLGSHNGGIARCLEGR